MKEKFDKWNLLKQKIETKKPVQFRQGQMYFMPVGQNIGFEVYEKKIITALLNQIRVFEIKRSEYYDGYINVSDFGKLKKKLLDLFDITPNPKGSGHSSKKLPKNKESISKKCQ